MEKKYQDNENFQLQNDDLTIIDLVDFKGRLTEDDIFEINQELIEQKLQFKIANIGGPIDSLLPEIIEGLHFTIRQLPISVGSGLIVKAIVSGLKFLYEKIIKPNGMFDHFSMFISYSKHTEKLEIGNEFSTTEFELKIGRLIEKGQTAESSDFQPKG